MSKKHEWKWKLKWTGGHLKNRAVALFGHGYGWQKALAEIMGVSTRTVRDWYKNGPPDERMKQLHKLGGPHLTARLTHWRALKKQQEG